MNLKKISAEEFMQLKAKTPDVFIIDVRTPVEFAGCHIQDAKLFPLQELSVASVLLEAEKTEGDAPIYVLCKAGGRAMKAAEQIAPETTRDVVVIEGGTDACVACNMEANYGKERMSLERQVRIAAGALIVAGVLLGWFVAPAYYWLSAAVGAGLFLAGVTGSCLMGMVLARMPWNQLGRP